MDYDLVIIGDTPEGRYAAKMATALNYRVALVQQPCELSLQGKSQIYNLAIREWLAAKNSAIKLEDWIARIIERVNHIDSPYMLAAAGVDYLAGTGKFSCSPELSIIVGKRKLIARFYLIATGSYFPIPKIANLTAVGYLSIIDIYKSKKLTDLPNKLLIIGDSHSSLELAYILNKLGKKITFVWLNNDFLVQEDKEIAELIQADLEASGIKIYSNLKLNSIETWQGKKRVIFNQRKITCDEIILACGEKAYLASLNLAKAEVKIDDQGIVVNQYLQTSNRRIYAFGGVIGGYNYTQIGQYEASIVLQNCLFKSHATVNYYAVPWAMFTQPNLARVGMNERQANKFYRQNILITKKMFNHNPWSIATNQTTGICKLISSEDGIILGASIIGNNGIELINLIAEIMQKSLKLETNSLRDILTSPSLFVYPSFCQILAQAQLNLTKQKLLLNKKKKQTFEQLWQWIKD